MKPGDEVTIYEDSRTKKKPRGKVRLIKCLLYCGTYNGLAVNRWTVEHLCPSTYGDEPGEKDECTLIG